MKRLPFLFGLLAVVALSSSVAYWSLQFFRPAQRPLAAQPAPVLQPPPAEAAATLFGGQAQAAVASNYQLKGVIAANRAVDAVAIIAVDGKAPAAYKVGKEVAPGVTLKSVETRAAVLADGPNLKRLELPADNRPTGLTVNGPAAAAPAAPPAPPVTPLTPMTGAAPAPSPMTGPPPSPMTGMPPALTPTPTPTPTPAPTPAPTAGPVPTPSMMLPPPQTGTGNNPNKQ